MKQQVTKRGGQKDVRLSENGRQDQSKLVMSRKLGITAGLCRLFISGSTMAVTGEEIHECNHEGRGNGRVLGSPVLKPPEKRKHLVAASLPNSELSNNCEASGKAPATHWMATSMALNVILISTLLLQRSFSAFNLMFHSSEPGTTLCFATDSTAFPNSLPCSGHGHLTRETDGSFGTCVCHACYGGDDCSEIVSHCIIDLDHGDPTMFEAYWLANVASSTTVILGWQRMSYFAQSQHFWFMEPELDQQIRALHQLVGNAVTQDRHIVVGTGSTQLFQAALYALSSPERSKPTSIVSAAPFYSSYPSVTDYLRSALYKWAGDAAEFKQNSEDDGYIELVTSPNNPDGRIHQAVVNGTGPVVHDLAYYWPHYTPITSPADHDLMLFTVSKSTGHAGTRIGWAIVKDEAVARKMAKFIELNTIGVSQDSQLRATQIIRAVVDGYVSKEASNGLSVVNFNRLAAPHLHKQKLFHYGNSVMQYRWTRLRAVLASSSHFTLLDFSSAPCTFFHEIVTPTPAFAWLRCIKEMDCQAFLKARGILTRSGRHFGAAPEYVRLSMLDRSQSFEVLLNRLATMDWLPPD